MKTYVGIDELRSLVNRKQVISANAIANEYGYSFSATLKSRESVVLRTHREAAPKLYKRADALLKEAASVGLSKITFGLQ